MFEVFGKGIYESVDEIVQGGGLALVLVDVMNDFFHHDGYFGKAGRDMSDMDAMLPPLGRLLKACRAGRIQIIHIQNTVLQSGRSDSSAFLRFKTKYAGNLPAYSIEGTWGWEFLGAFTPELGELVVKKHRPSGFVGTDLDQLLSANQIQSVVITGCVTEGCVQSTAVDAMFRDYHTIVVRDCVGTYDRRLHEAALTYLAPRVELAESSAIIDAIAK